MDWQPILIAIGSLITAFFTALRWGVKPYLERRTKKRSEKEKELRSKIERRIMCRNSIDYNIRNRVLPNEVDKYPADIFFQGFPQEFSTKAKEYMKNYQRLQDWLRASRLAVRYEIETRVRSELPTTRKEYNLDTVLESDKIMPFFIEGQRVNKRWIEANYPKIYKNTIKHLKEEETALHNWRSPILSFVALSCEIEGKPCEFAQGESSCLLNFGFESDKFREFAFKFGKEPTIWKGERI